MKARLGFKLALAMTVGMLTYLLVQPKPASSAFDLQGLNQQVQRHDEQLQNHEARIDNLENDTQATKTVVEQKVAPVPTPEPQPVPRVTTPPQEEDQAPLPPEPSSQVVTVEN